MFVTGNRDRFHVTGRVTRKEEQTREDSPMSSLRNGLRPDRPEFCFRPVVCAAEGRAQRALGGQACAYEAPGMAHGDVDMSDVHGDSAAADDEPWPAALFTKPRLHCDIYVHYT